LFQILFHPTLLFIQNEKKLKQIEKDFVDYLYRNSKLTLFKIEELKLFSKQDESLEDFRIRVQDRLNEKVDEQLEKLKIKYQKENDAIELKISKLYEKLDKEKREATASTTDTILNIGTSILGAFFGRGNEIHYIGGTEILPAPLDTAEEQKMIHMLGTVNEETARSMLIERNLRLVVYIAKKFDNTGIGVEDLISIGTIGLIKAINTFNPAKKIKLATYASRCIENEILMYLRRNNKTKYSKNGKLLK
jgi:DNA-directed RNA polymerase sigma subunit (sigma70/sigma32)